MITLAANLTMMFREHDFLDRFAAAADCGFKAVEYLLPFDYEPEVLKARLDDNGLTQALFNCPAGDWAAGDRGLAALPARQAEFDASIAPALRYADALGNKRLHLMAGIAQAGDAAAIEAYRRNVRTLAEAAAGRGIDILLEPINGRDMPGYFLNGFDQAAALIRDLALPNVKLQFDIYHRQVSRGDVLTGIRELADITGHVQIASVPTRAEPGTGELNDLAALRGLTEAGYAGYVGCEYVPAGGTKAGLGWIEAARKAVPGLVL